MNKNSLENLKKALGETCKENEPMSNHTTLKIGGPARLFVKVKTEVDLKKCIKVANKFKIPFLVIGRGSNLLVHDRGFEGLVIENCIKGIRILKEKIIVKSGTNLQEFINFIIKKGYAGMEKMSGIPGTVGGAIFGNAGAYGQSISGNLIGVRAFDGTRASKYSKNDCGFGYRESIFKENNNIILEAEFKFNNYSPELLKKISLDTIELRFKKYPSEMLCPGSFFKNLPVEDISEDVLKNIPKDDIIYGKIPAGYLMEAVGANGTKKGNIKIADYHGNLIINLGGGKASDFYELAMGYAKKVNKKFGIELEPEVNCIGFNNSKSNGCKPISPVGWKRGCTRRADNYRNQKVAVLGLGVK